MSVTDWIFFGITFLAIFWAVWSLRVAANLRFQVENVQMAAANARQDASTQRHLVDALTKVIKAYEGQLVEAYKGKKVVEEMNRMLVAAQPKPRVRRAPAESRTTGKPTGKAK